MDVGARVEYILRLAEEEAENIRREARRPAPPVPADAERLHILLATENGRISLVGDRIYTDLQDARDRAAEHQASVDAERNVRYSVGVIMPVDEIG